MDPHVDFMDSLIHFPDRFHISPYGFAQDYMDPLLDYMDSLLDYMDSPIDCHGNPYGLYEPPDRFHGSPS